MHHVELFSRASKPRALLGEIDAAEIYKYRREQPCRFAADPLLLGNAAKVAELFNVSPKTIRDIWNRRTWICETRHLWREEDQPTLRYKKSRSIILNSVNRVKFSTRMSTTPANIGRQPHINHVDDSTSSKISSIDETVCTNSTCNYNPNVEAWELAFDFPVKHDHLGAVDNDPFHYDWPYW